MKDAVEVDEKLRTETPKLNQAFAKERICKAEFEGLKERMSKNVREVSTCRARQYALTKRGFELSELQYTQFKHLEKMQTVLVSHVTVDCFVKLLIQEVRIPNFRRS
ncbi:hypothetical protein EJ08DRAFT_1358 [Tothia fuscella]|uniref:Uncharacterized protein n=1 Tax=Tothia fuscella TaxID=1048955 RepID=A0A9P4U551_9PEZI|nr:hypothetical protein EJ08DRAFT_1358 [Tothia fuscella]